ncbi:MAG: phosphatase PAP2 family protein [Chloroflexi bacterium]|nr:phosphatase PAP2 family protein [Chloroflexota bacterium]MDA1270295.1 phosphatase PAP2 family protein [Chloroflexota bacterium]
MATIRFTIKRYPLLGVWLSHFFELGIVAGGYFAYMYTKSLVFSDFQTTAFNNAWRVIKFESDLGIFWEPVMQAWAIDSAKAMVVFFNWAYIVTFWPIILTTAVILYFTNRTKYRYYRNVVLVSFAIAVVAFMVFPLAPPRMMALYFIDTIQVFGPSEYASREMVNYFNAFAAMPSLHFAWTVMFGLLFLKTPYLWLKILGVIYPTMTFFAITITANHYMTDALGGGLVILSSYLIVEIGFKRRFFIPQIANRVRRRNGSGTSLPV